MFEFHISRQVRDRYGFEDVLFALTGNVVLANMAASREFSERINRVRAAASHPERAVHPAQLNAMGLIDEALHAVVEAYRKQIDPRVMLDALDWFGARLGTDALDRVLLNFADTFPVVAVYRGRQRADEWLAGSTDGVTHRTVALEELLLLWLANANPAFTPFKELFDDGALAKSSPYLALASIWREYFATRPRYGPEKQNLVDMLRAPALAAPDSLDGQLAFLRDKWPTVLGDFVRRMLVALDVLKEEQTAVWMRFHPPARQEHFGQPQTWAGGDSSVAAVPEFKHLEPEYERFSPDLDWMPRTVMIAKTVYVWLDQLSKEYKRPITSLDQVPEEELQQMARRGFNGLWLIGLWERSRASQQIKQLCGNPEAAASAYSLYDYTIAEDMGGEHAYEQLRARAGASGIRLASDMVPNHMGIDSRWMMEHPDWFLSLPQPPYPAYSFNGPDLTPNGGVEIKVEDHYFDRTDAAVVFRRVDRSSGDTRYIYHGNDGTSFPWNDTAQLNYLMAEVREAVIQTILHVARKFPIIRFDAAMTLAKRHYQRLWFPEPGTGGAIPSRAEHGLTKAQFDAAIPVEFWREVVDRVTAEAPSTLLLAEAFWLMEGYFVRTLGMHRVYNSAFMNMLRDEENANYRSVIKNTLTFDPEILKRYVNFMNNPDERTAVDQFGKGDKYFGACTLMATLPGLPMFGHGQIEGYTERYGMEYRRAYYDEQPDAWLVARHEREISPLLRRRYQFAEVENFLLYDFFSDEGTVNEDVFAYSNRSGQERALVVFNNRYAGASGWVRISCAYAEKHADVNKSLRQKTLGETFGLSDDASLFAACRDSANGLEFLFRARDLSGRGMNLDLQAYQCHVFLDWRDLREDGAHPWGELCDSLAGNGVPSLEDALRSLQLQPVHRAVLALLDAPMVQLLAESAHAKDADFAGVPASGMARLDQRMSSLLKEIQRYVASGAGETAGIRPPQGWRPNAEAARKLFAARISSAVQLPTLLAALKWPPESSEVLPVGQSAPVVWTTLLAWSAVEAIAQFINSETGGPEKIDVQAQSFSAVNVIDGLRLREPLAETLAALGLEGDEKWRTAARVRASFAHAGNATSPWTWAHDPDVAWVSGVHQHEGTSYLVKEHFERLLWWMIAPELLDIAGERKPDLFKVAGLHQRVIAILKRVAEAGYRVESLQTAAPPKAAVKAVQETAKDEVSDVVEVKAATETDKQS